FFNPEPAKKYNIEVHDPEDNGFFSKTPFVKDGANKYRPYIIDYPINPRVIVFCNEFHHIYDKRTTNATFASKQVWGARAAKIDDTTISYKTRPDNNAAVDAGYVHRTRVFDMVYLHYGATDGTTVYHGLVSYWNTRLFYKNSDVPSGWNLAEDPVSNSVNDVRNYRDEGMKRAMGRWNGKGYQFELADKSTDIVVKPFFLFEVKDVEQPNLTFN